MWRQLDDASPESPIYLVKEGDAEGVYGSAISEEPDAVRIGTVADYLERGLEACFVGHWARPNGPGDEALAIAKARCANLFAQPMHEVTLKRREPTNPGWEVIELRVEAAVANVYATDVLGWLADASPTTFAELFDVDALKFGNRIWGQTDVAREVVRKASGKGMLVTAQVPALLVDVQPGASWFARGVTSSRFKWSTAASLKLSPLRPDTALGALLAAPKPRPRKRPR